MAKYRKKPVIVDATQWFKNGDHPQDDTETFRDKNNEPFEGEGQVVRYYRTPELDGLEGCDGCGETMHLHGWIDALVVGHIVCPGDWIITDVNGEKRPIKPDIFEQTYDKVCPQKKKEGGDKMKEKTVLEKTNNIIGIVSNMNHRCICGAPLLLAGIITESQYAHARLSCSNEGPGLHSSIIIEEKRDLTPRTIGKVQDMCGDGEKKPRPG